MAIDTSKVKGFFTYFDQCEPLEELTNEQAGELFKAMVALFQGKPFEFTDPMVKFAFRFFEQSFKRDAEKYVNKCEKMRTNINKRHQKNTDEYNCIQLNTIEYKSTQQPEPEQDNNILFNTPNGVFVGKSLADQSATTVPNCPHARIVSLYHECLPELPKVKVWEGERQSHLQTRWRERWKAGKYVTLEEGLEYWRRLFVHIHDNCPWLMGQVSGKDGRPPFRADLAWLVLPRNFAKLIEGRYDREAA